MNPDIQRYFRLNLVLSNCTQCLINLFKQSWKELTHEDWTNDLKSGKQFINEIGYEFFKHSKKIQQKMLKDGKIEFWDLTLFGEIFKLPKFYTKKFDQKFSSLLSIRNKLSHNPSSKVSPEDFELFWFEICEFLNFFNYDKEIIQKLKDQEINIVQKSVVSKPEVPNNSEAVKLKESGNQAFKAGTYKKAIDFYSKALSFPENSSCEMSVLYSNRSASYYEIFLISKKEIDHLLQALMDAKQCVYLNPFWFKGYWRLALIYVELGKYEKAIVNLERALAGNPELINYIANLKAKKGQKERNEHLDPRLLPKSHEENNEDVLSNLKDWGLKTTENDLELVNKQLEKLDPSYKDVFLAHQYRDGSKNYKQDYIMAAQLYSKSAMKNNAEALFNLATLTKLGKGVKQDYKMAFKMFEKAANLNHFIKFDKSFKNIPNVGVMESQGVLGNFYREGEYVDQSFIMAIYWYERAIEGGSDIAANNLGLMYMHGIGVAEDLKNAEKFLLIAHSRKDPNASNNLAELYIKLGDDENALKWHTVSINSGSFESMSKDKEIKDRIKKIQELNKKMKEKIKDEKKIPNTFSVKTTLEEYRKETNDFKEIFAKKGPVNISNPNKFDPKLLKQFSEQGSLTAQKICLVQVYSTTAYEYLLKGNETEFITNLSNAIQIDESVIQMQCNMISTVRELLDVQLVKNKNIVSEFDKNTRICYLYNHMEDHIRSLEFASISARKYPQCKLFFVFKGIALNFMDRRPEGLVEFNAALKLDPENIEILYHKAATLRLIEGKFEEALKTYEIFLSKCPVDHRKIPESYYAIALLHFYKGNQTKARKFYEMGVNAEKNQLPFYLPYVSNSRKHLEIFI